MPLILAPSIDAQTREEVEQHIEVISALRLQAAITYQAGVNAKLGKEAAKLQARLEREYAMLMKEVEALNKAEIKVRERLEKLDNVQNELGLTIDSLNLPPEMLSGSEQEDDDDE